MKIYNTLSKAVSNLQARGYKHDFKLAATCSEFPSLELKVQPQDCMINEMYRFEGMSSTIDNSILLGRRILLNAYGIYSENTSDEMKKKLRSVNQ